MTQTDVSAALTPAIERGVIAARQNPNATLKELAEAITDEPPLYWGGTDLVPFPPVAPPVVLTDDALEALKALPTVFGKVQPTERRTLSEAEIKAAYDEDVVLKQVEEVIAGRREALKTTIRHHFDVAAEEENRAVPRPVVVKSTGEVKIEASPRDPAGHYVLGEKGKPERLPIPGTNMAYSREMRGGSTTISGARLDELFAAGEISRDDYLAFTKEKRVFDEEKARKAVDKDHRLYGLLARITERKGVGSALFIRKNSTR